MKRGFLYFFAFLLLGSIFGFLVFAPSENACGEDCCIDGISDLPSDLDSQSPNPISLVFMSQPAPHPFPFHSLMVFYRQKIEFLTNILRLESP
jgi:hypothetical protein